MTVLALVNARGGSKGIPGKNIKPLLGKPLIAYSIAAGLGADNVDTVVVSTDDPAIAAAARTAGARVPFTRPAELASDTSIQIDTIIHAIEWLKAAGERYDVLCLLQPTSPGRTSADVTDAIDRFLASDADSLISVTEVGGRHPTGIYTAADSGVLAPLVPSDPAGTLRQHLPDYVYRNGAIFLARIPMLLERRSLYGDITIGYEMPAVRAMNIDEPLDWLVAEAILRATAIA